MSVITHVDLNNNIHHLVFSEASRRATDQFLHMLIKFYQGSEIKGLYLLLDMRESGMLPLQYLTKKIREVFSRYPEHPRAYIAVVLDDPQLLTATQDVLRTIMYRDSIHYFTNIDKARLWLKLEQGTRPE